MNFEANCYNLTNQDIAAGRKKKKNAKTNAANNYSTTKRKL